MIEVTDEMLKVARSMQSFELMIQRIIELHEANKPKPEPVGLGEEWMPCIKLPVIVHVRKQRQDEQHVSTREGITPVKPDDLIMRGVSGEEYLIGSEIFNKTYTLDTTTLTREPLSEEEIEKLVPWQGDSKDPFFSRIEFARAIEKAHGISTSQTTT
jgi:hypothetical protein